MATAQLKSVFPGCQVRNGKRGKSIRFFTMINGQRFTKTCTLPAEIMLTPNGTATRELRAEYGKWVAECSGKTTVKFCRNSRMLRVPTIDELLRKYEEIAWKRNRDPNYARPAARSIETAIKNFGYCVEASGLKDSAPITKLMDPEMIRKVFNVFMSRGVTGVSAWSYVSALQSVTATWAIAEYRDAGFLVQKPTMPDFGKAKDPQKYTELSSEMIGKIWQWYMMLEKNANPDCVFYATCMLELAIRPSDIGRLTAANFPTSSNGHHRLVYRPNKTSESSNRRVDIEIPDALWEKLHKLKADVWESGELLLPNVRYVETTVNATMRISCGMAPDEFSKASYELRKLCIQTIINTPVEQGGGVDQAVRLSGDRRDTIEDYYCDPYKGHTPLPSMAFERFARLVGAIDEKAEEAATA